MWINTKIYRKTHVIHKLTTILKKPVSTIISKYTAVFVNILSHLSTVVNTGCG